MPRVRLYSGLSVNRSVFLGSSGPLANAALTELLASGVRPQTVLVAGAAPETRSDDPLGVISEVDLYTIAESHGVSAQPTMADSDNAIRSAILELDYRPDLLVVACLATILSQQTLMSAECCLNIHPSLLPQYRGPAPVFWQLRDGVKQGGVSVHHIQPEIDAGPVVAQNEVRWPELVTEPHAEYLAGEVGARLLATWLSTPEPKPAADQKQQLATYQSHPHDTDFEIDARLQNATDAFRFIRGTHWRQHIYPVTGENWRAQVEQAYEVEPATVTVPSSSGQTLRLPFVQGTLVARGRLEFAG